MLLATSRCCEELGKKSLLEGFDFPLYRIRMARKLIGWLAGWLRIELRLIEKDVACKKGAGSERLLFIAHELYNEVLRDAIHNGVIVFSVEVELPQSM